MTASRAYIPAAATTDWRTPVEVVDLLHVLWGGKPSIDPCASRNAPKSELIADVNFFGGSPAQDGLLTPWNGTAFVNPPFGDLAAWVEKARHEHAKRRTQVVLLLPARTDTRYWHDHISHSAAICFWRGRMRFLGATASAPFPTALVYWGSRPWDFHCVFSPRGMIVTP